MKSTSVLWICNTMNYYITGLYEGIGIWVTK